MANVKKTKYRTVIVFDAESELNTSNFSDMILNRILPEYEFTDKFNLTKFEVEEVDYPEIKVED